MVRPALPEVIVGYHCAGCEWAQEGTVPSSCRRCARKSEWIIPLTRADLLGMLDAHIVKYCPACTIVHLR